MIAAPTWLDHQSVLHCSKTDQNIVVILPDAGERYLTTAMFDFEN